MFMKVDLTKKILDKNGDVVISKSKEPIAKDVNGEEVEIEQLVDKEVELGHLLINAMIREDGEISEEEVLQRYEMFKRLNNATEIEASEEDVKFLKKMACKCYSVMFAGQILEMLTQ